MYPLFNKVNLVEKLPSTPTPSMGTKHDVPSNMIPLDVAITQKFSDVVYALNLRPDHSDGRPFLIPGPPPPSPVTPGQTTPRFRNRIPSKLVNYQDSPGLKMETNTDDQADSKNHYDVNDTMMDEIEPNVTVTVEDLNKVLDENGDYCKKIYNSNPWFQYILLGDEGQEGHQRKENIPGASSHDGGDGLGLEQFMESLNNPGILNPEEIKVILGIDLSVSPSSGCFQCGRCSQNFQTREEIQEHLEKEKDCESNLMGTVVGFDLGQ